MWINGCLVLVCKENIRNELVRLEKIVINNCDNFIINIIVKFFWEIIIFFMGNMLVIKDLIVDMNSFWWNLEVVEFYVSMEVWKVLEWEFL